jgi:hypothetical protein
LAWFAAWSNISRRFGFQLEALLGPCHSKLAFCLTAKVRSKSAHGTDEAGVLFFFRFEWHDSILDVFIDIFD